MNARQFFELTAQVREVQREYLATPTVAYRRKAELFKQEKRLEDQLDAEIKRVKAILEAKRIESISPVIPGFEYLNREDET